MERVFGVGENYDPHKFEGLAKICNREGCAEEINPSYITCKRHGSEMPDYMKD